MNRYVGATLMISCLCGCEHSAAPETVALEESGSPRPPAALSKELPVSAGPQAVTLKIEGMVCQGCAEAARRAVVELPGVTAVEVDFAEGAISVAFDRAETSTKDLISALEGLDRGAAPGFRVTAVAHN